MRAVFIADAHLLDPADANYRALLAFLAAQLLTLRRAFRHGDSWGLYLAVSLAMLCFDGGLVIGSPDELWLLDWLPAALIANRNTSNESLHATN